MFPPGIPPFLVTSTYLRVLYLLSTNLSRVGCARVIECNWSSSAHHRVYRFFPTHFNLVGKGSGHAQTTRDTAERQSPDGKKHPFLMPVRTKSASS